MSLLGRVGEEFDRWHERRTLPGLLRQHLETEPPSDGSLSDMVTVAIARQEVERALEVWAQAN